MAADDLGRAVSEFWAHSIVGPFVGGLIGAFVYDLGIRDTLLARGEEPAADLEQRGRTVEDQA